MLLTPAQIKPKSFESRRNSFVYPGWMCLMFTCVLGRYEVASTVLSVPTLRASLSGTFLQTLPDLVTPLKGHSIFISAQLSMQRRGQRPPKGSGTNMTVEAT